MQATPNPQRLEFLDWMRGAAAAVMLVGHTFHSFTRSDLRNTGPYILSQFVGGMPPAIFLFLTGVTLAFLLDRRERQGVPAAGRVTAGVRRAGYLLALAFLFRLQLYLFGWPQTEWRDLLRVDILNCMGLALLVFSVMGVFQTAERVRFAAVLGVVIAAASPLVSQADWSRVPPVVRSYFAPTYAGFAFFPWAAFLAFGLSAGSLIRLLRGSQMERAMLWAALAGSMLIAGGRYFADIPYALYAKADFWLDSPLLVFIKLGVILWLGAIAYLWTHREPSPGWSWLRQLGTTSLLVYWVHIELVYGRWLGRWKEQLSIAETAAAAGSVVLLMVALAALRSNYRRLALPAWLRRYPAAPDRVSGD